MGIGHIQSFKEIRCQLFEFRLFLTSTGLKISSL